MKRSLAVIALGLGWLFPSLPAYTVEPSDEKKSEEQVVFTEQKEDGKEKKKKESGRPAFEVSELFMGRNIKPAKRAKVFTVGMKVGGAPFDFAVSALRDEAIKASCANSSSPRTCESIITQGLNRLASLSDSEWNTLVTAVQNRNEDLYWEQAKKAGLSDEEIKQVDSYLDKACPKDEPCSTLNAVRYVARSKASILLGPYIDINLAPVEILAEFPLVLVLSEGSTDPGIGNLNVEAKIAKHFDLRLVNLGVGGGLHLYFPTGSKDPERTTFGFLFHAPKYLYGYLSWAPYLVVGMDSRLVTVQGYGELVLSHKVRSRQDLMASQIIHAKYGVGFTLLPDFFISVIGEINGVAPVYKSDDYLAVYGSGGILLHLWVLKFGTAVVTPVYEGTGDGKSLPPVYGVNVSQLSKFSLIAHLALVF